MPQYIVIGMATRCRACKACDSDRDSVDDEGLLLLRLSLREGAAGAGTCEEDRFHKKCSSVTQASMTIGSS